MFGLVLRRRLRDLWVPLVVRTLDVQRDFAINDTDPSMCLNFWIPEVKISRDVIIVVRDVVLDYQ